MNSALIRNTLIVAVSLLAFSCKEERSLPTKTVAVTYPEKAKDFTIYEVNIRQHTSDGTFNAFQEELPKLKELGVDMLWIMPVQPIGELNRKGSLGSYYSIKDYKKANPEFGTLDDFKALVNKAHELDFHVILDWVPNHSSWDNVWITEHPEYYMTDSAARVVGGNLGMAADYYKKKGIGNLVYEADWDDIALLNLYHEGTQNAMIDAMKFWVTETNIDGFRVDHPTEEIPLFFWENATRQLNPLKDLFWLAERDEARVHTVFHATYEWGLLSMIEEIGKGHEHLNAESVHNHILFDMATYGRDAFRLNMITNHDRNAWEGTIKEMYGEGDKAMAVFSFVSYGVPVMYSGQEVGLNKRLKFFEKDPIDWNDPDGYFPFYQKLNQLKAENPALWNGSFGGMPEKLEDNNHEVFSVRRTKAGNTVIAVINMSGEEQNIKFSQPLSKPMTDVFTNAQIQLTELKLMPWQYFVFVEN